MTSDWEKSKFRKFLTKFFLVIGLLGLLFIVATWGERGD